MWIQKGTFIALSLSALFLVAGCSGTASLAGIAAMEEVISLADQYSSTKYVAKSTIDKKGVPQVVATPSHQQYINQWSTGLVRK